MKYEMGQRLAVSLVITSIIIAIIFSIVAAFRNLSSLENVLLQYCSLIAGLIGSYIFGRQSAKEAGTELIKLHAKSAFRRLMSLYSSLSRLAAAIQTARNEENSDSSHLVLDKLEALVVEQIATADDALEDWNDIVPEEVSALRDKLSKKHKREKIT